MRSYKWWQAQLAKEHFGPDRNGRPLLFYIGDDEVTRLYGDARATDSIDDLCTAVAQEAIDWHRDAYEQIYRDVLDWKRSSQDEPPPCLPLLAVCVLAATHMHGKGGRGPFAYYARLAELLPPPNWYRGSDYEKHLKRDYDTVGTLWRTLDTWLKERGGTRGFSTLHASKGRELIGYAQSQALVCAADQERLARFFDEVQARDTNTLLRKLRGWKDRPRLSRRLREALDKESEDEILGPLLVSLAEPGSRVLPVPSGLRRLRLRINATMDHRDGWTLNWRAERVAGVDCDELEHSNGHLVVEARGQEVLCTLSGHVPDLGQALEKGLSACGERLGISLQPQRFPLILQADPLGGWTEVDKAAPYKPSLILFNERSEGDARKLVEQAGFDWEGDEPSSVDGWFVAPDIEFADGPRGRQARLSGGLHLRVTGERKHYLVGGEPDLVARPDLKSVNLDDAPISIEGKLTELRGRGLNPGEHVIDTGVGPRLVFYLHPLRKYDDSAAARPSKIYAKPSPDGEHTVIDAEGYYTDLAPSATPAWWHMRKTGLKSAAASMEIPESAVWLVIDRPDGTIEVKLLRREEPRITRLTPTMQKFWTVMFTIEHPPPEKLWKKYLLAVWKLGSGRG